MAEYSRIEKAEEYDTIDVKECTKGYFDARDGKELPSSENLYSRSYYQGFLNGLVDSGRRKIDIHQQRFARNLIKSGKLEGIFGMLEGMDQTYH